MNETVTPEDARLYQALLDHSVDNITLIDQQGTVLYQNRASEQFGYAADELLGHSIFDLLHPDDLELAITSFAKLVDNIDIDRIVIRLKDKSGIWREVEVVGSVYPYQGETAMILNTRDVTAHREMLQELETSEALLETAFNSTSTICTMTDLESGEFIAVNDAWVTSTGWTRDEAIGRTAHELGIWGDTGNRERVVAALKKQQKLKQYPSTYQNRHGEQRSILLDVDIVEVNNRQVMFLAGIDITERELIEAQLRQSQRLEAVGQLTGGIAHDLNNMLTVILGQVDLHQSRQPTTEKSAETMSVVRQAAERGADLIKQLMIFSRRQMLNPATLDVAETLRKMETFLTSTLGEEIAVRVRIDGDLWLGHLDESLLESAILNLALNARDAMPDGGTLTLSANNVTLGNTAATDYDINAGDYIYLSINDTGLGMDETTIANAFEPFFTTKPIDQGTGLGLSMVFGFVKQSGGHIYIDSARGSGTTVSVYLPRSKDVAPTASTSASDQQSLTGQSVLLIEDNAELREVIRLLLESMGCEVYESDGLEIPELSRKIDLILSDVVLAGIKQGPELANEALKDHPGAKVVFMSGYPKDRLKNVEVAAANPLLKKPFSRDELQTSLCEALSRR